MNCRVYHKVFHTCQQGWGLAIILMAIKINQKIRWGPSDEKRRKKMQLLAWYTTKDEKKLIPSRAHKKTRKSHILGTYEKKMWFSLTKGVLSYIFWRKWSCLNQREQFQWYFCMWWRCSHSYSMYKKSLFLYEVGLTEVQKKIFKISPHDKRQRS